jgi:hypothetical protein
MERMPLKALADAVLVPQTTLVIPPARAMVPNRKVIDRLAELEAQASAKA